MRILGPALIAAACWFALVSRPAAQQPEEATGRALFHRAQQQARAGELERALETLAALTRDLPDDSYADDALAERARLSEEELGRPQRALELWRELLGGYPSSRLARRARARIEFLARHLDQGEAALAEYQAILRRVRTQGAEQTLEQMQRLLKAHPGFSLQPDGLLLIAGLLAAEGRLDQAREVLGQVIDEYAGQPAAGSALSLLAGLEIDAGDLGAAERAFEKLARLPGEEAGRASREGRERISGLRWRQRALAGSFGLWALALLASLTGVVGLVRRGRLSLSSLLRPPIEALVYLLVMGVLVVVVWGRAQDTLHALLWMSALVFPVLLASGWAMRGLRLGWAGLLGWMLGGLVLHAACAWAAICLAGMVDQVLHTLQFGTG